MDILEMLSAECAGDGAGRLLDAVEAVASRVEQLANSEFDAGLRALKQAQRAQPGEQPHLLREARGRFNKAVSLEKEERLALAHLGLAFCHAFLGDYHNARDSLQAILNVQIVQPGNGAALGGGAAVGAVLGTLVFPGVGTVLGGAFGATLAGGGADASWRAANRHRFAWLNELKEAAGKVSSEWNSLEERMRARAVRRSGRGLWGRLFGG